MGQIGPPAFLMPFPALQADQLDTTSREAHPDHCRSRAKRLVPLSALHPSSLESTVTATMIEQPKIDAPALRPAVWPVAVGVPALLIDGVSKRFVVGRNKKAVAAITDVSMRLERGDIHGDPRRQRLGASRRSSGSSAGLLTLDEGRVEVFGHDIERDEMAVKRLINRVSVDAAFFKKLSPMENLHLRGAAVRPRWADRQARRDRDPGPARASARSASTVRSSR